MGGWPAFLMNPKVSILVGYKIQFVRTLLLLKEPTL
jgi:hypothetical protein